MLYDVSTISNLPPLFSIRQLSSSKKCHFGSGTPKATKRRWTWSK
jgi:hypothetical protein